MDYLFRGIARDEKVRILGIDASESVCNICKAHQTLPLTTVALGRFLLAGAMLGALEKDGNGVTLKIDSDGVAGGFFMQATQYGSIRGYVNNAQGELTLNEGEISLESVVGRNGILSVSKLLDDGQEFTSNVILMGADIIKDIAYYFFTSEQIPTILNLQIDLDESGNVKDAKGYLIQLLTGYDEEDLQYLENLKLERIENIEKEISKIFPDFTKLETIKVKDSCNCSKERYTNNLKLLSLEDLEDLAQEDIEIVCQFCAKKYIFTPDELKEIINKKLKKRSN